MSTATVPATATMADTDFGEKLRNETSGCRLSTSQLTTNRAMTAAQIAQVADLFGAEEKSLGGTRKMINRKLDIVAPVYSLILEARAYVKARTIDFPEQGVRLIKLSQVEKMAEEVAKRKAELDEHLAILDSRWEEVKADARERLDMLYQESDYAVIPSQCFALAISFPAIRPDERLKKLSPELYQAEKDRIAARFDEAVQNAEAAAAGTLKTLLEHFIERLKPESDGKKKVLKSSVLDNIRDFVELFKENSIGSNAQLEQIVTQVDALAGDLDLNDIRKAGPEDKTKVVNQLDTVLGQVSDLVKSKPVRVLDID